MRRGLTRRAFGRTLLAAGATSFAGACRPTSTGQARDPEHAFEPGQPLPWRNWGGNQSCRPERRFAPRSEGELAQWLASSRGVVRPVGAGHSFSALVPTDETLLAIDRLHGLVAVGQSQRGGPTAEVWAGTRLHELGPLLHAQGQALPNLPDIDDQTLAGALATATHGTGSGFTALHGQVSGLTLVSPAGAVLDATRERNPELFAAARVSLGALGVVTRVRLDNVTPFRLRETTRFEPVADVLDDLEARFAEHRHFEFLALPHGSLCMTVTTDPLGADEPAGIPDVEDPDAVYQLRDLYRSVGAVPVVGDFLYDRLLRLAADDAATVRSGDSFRVLTHHRMARFREMEYTVPADAGAACLREVLDAIRSRGLPVVFPIEFRRTRRDDAWLSMFHERDGCSISIHQYADEDHRPYFAEIEPIFWKYEGRPHWGKLHSLDAARLAPLYPRWRDFAELRRELDPDDRMRNEHLRRVLGA